MSKSKPSLGFIGLGVMGGGMCANLIRKQAAPVHVFDMNPDALAAMIVIGGLAAVSQQRPSRAP
jgi:3-hydroxyisobutyrate dehydrogenase-like beta-hydroxyacid dehydrogenase